MNKLVCRLGLSALVVSLVAFAAPVAAQTPKAEFGAAYQTSHIPDNWNPVGFNLDAAFRRSDKWSIVGELGMTRDSESIEGLASASLSDTNFGGGLRYHGHMSKHSAYFQLVAGGLRRKVGISVIGIDGSESMTKFMVQPGVGYTWPLMSRTGLNLDLAYRRVFFDEAADGIPAENQLRLAFGVRIGMK